MKTILSILNQTSETASKLEKLKILLENSKDITLKTVCRMTYEPSVRFFTRHTSEKSGDGERDLLSALQALEEKIASRVLTGHAGERFIDELSAELTADDLTVFNRVILRDLKCGASASTMNRVWPNLINEIDFALCETDPKDIIYPAISQTKEDGTRAKFIFNGQTVTLLSRNGNSIEEHGVFNEWARKYLKNNSILDGEIVAFENGKRLPRKDSNGIVNKAVRGTITPEEASKLRFIFWDFEDSNEIYEKRWRDILDATKSSVLGEGSTSELMCQPVETRLVGSYEEALAHFRSARQKGLEGTVLKNLHAKWVGKRTYDNVKFKAEIEAEFRVIGKVEGTGKNAGKLGALIIESECGAIKSNVGIFKDFPESVRVDWWINTPSVVTVLYNERIQSKDSATQSLFLPRVTAVRYDKDEANTLVEIIEIERGVLHD